MRNLESEEYERRIRWQNEEIEDREIKMDVMREGIATIIDKAADNLDKVTIAVAGADRMDFDTRVVSLFKALKAFVDERNELFEAKKLLSDIYTKYKESQEEKTDE